MRAMLSSLTDCIDLRATSAGDGDGDRLMVALGIVSYVATILYLGLLAYASGVQV